MSKFYILLRCPFLGIALQQYVVQAASEHEAIAKLWVHQFRSMHKISDEQLDHLIRGMLFNVEMSYDIHQGQKCEAREVRSAPALLLLDKRHQGYVLRCLKVLFEPFEVERFVSEAVEE